MVGADDTVARKDITTARAEAGSWIVTAGLAPGDRVVVSGLQRAQVGQPATATPWQPPAAPATPGAAPASTPAPVPAAPAGADPDAAEPAADDAAAGADASTQG